MPESPKDPIELLIQGRAHELGPGFPVRRVLPSVKRRTVGPFIFLDHFGPMTVLPGGDGMAVRPHPHIGLATVTYLFDGGIFHRDSLGYAQAIRPGDVNWMTAGSGIAHSERTEEAMSRAGFIMHGVQTWVALPRSHEETAPSFEHVPAARLPACAAPRVVPTRPTRPASAGPARIRRAGPLRARRRSARRQGRAVRPGQATSIR